MKKKRVVLIAIVIISLITASIASVASDEGYDFDFDTGGHIFELIETINPTHRDNGSRTFHCTRCGMIFTQTLFAPGCVWGPWFVVREATCTQEGLRRRNCNIEVTCYQTESIPATGHDFVEERIEPCCVEPGGIVYICQDCDYEDRREIIEPIGHRLLETVIQELSCIDYGEIVITCENCDYSDTALFGEPFEHQFIEIITIASGCQVEGEITFACETCDYSYTEPIAMLTHRWGDWVTEIPPKEGVAGSRYKRCEHCDELVREVIPALPSETMNFGVEEAVVTGANVIVWVVLFFLLSGEISFLLWRRNKKKEMLARIKYERSGDDGYEPI